MEEKNEVKLTAPQKQETEEDLGDAGKKGKEEEDRG